MESQHPGSVRLFQFKGINVFVHWTWFVAGYVLYQFQPIEESLASFLSIYLTLFGIVLLHEFGHALACRSVGGKAETIVLWPLGGVAFVQPPPRPGPTLWSIAAGPLVNVVLVPVTLGLVIWTGSPAEGAMATPLQDFAWTVFAINLVLLIFNMLPIYPLDGGQIVQSILWFFIGRAHSLYFAAGLGVIAGVAGIFVALFFQDYWLVLIACFVAYRAWIGVQIAKQMALYEPPPNKKPPFDASSDPQ